jgi:hypothetical protein
MKKYSLLFAAVFVMAFLFASSAKATNYSAPLVADTWLDTANPNATHPTGDLTLYYNNGAWQWSTLLIKFDTSQIPANSTIVSSSLNIVQKSCSGYSSPVMYAKRVTSNWVEDTATWQVMQNRVTGQIQNTVFPCNVGSNIPFNVTDVVQSWANGTTPNYGFRVDPDTSQNSASFNFGIYGKGGYLPAYLQVYYNPPATPSGTTGTAGTGSGTTGGTIGTPSASSGTNSSSNSSVATTNPDGTPITNSPDGTTKENSPVSESETKSPTVMDVVKNPTKIFTSGWPWWKKAIIIWAALAFVASLVLGIVLLVKKVKLKKERLSSKR